MNFFDLHADTPLVLDSNNPKSSVVDLSSHPFQEYKQVMAIFLNEDLVNPVDAYNRRMKLIKSHLKDCNFPFLNQEFKSSCGALLSVENAGFLANDIEFLLKLKDDGISFLSLTWNNDNLLASGANGDGGITQKGKDVIKFMNEIGIALDISHLSHKAAMEGICLADRVLASHSAIFTLNPHSRNIKDETLLSLKQKNGIIGLCLYPLFLGGDDVAERLADSAEYLVNLGLENNIAIGTDFDGADMAFSVSKTDHISSVFNTFCRRGFEKSTVEAIFYENAIAFFNKICENKLL